MHRSPLHPLAQEHVQSAFCVPPFWHVTLHWQVPARSQDPKLGTQLLESQRVSHTGPYWLGSQLVHSVKDTQVAHSSGHSAHAPECVVWNPSLQTQEPSPLLSEALGLHWMQVVGLVHCSQPERRTAGAEREGCEKKKKPRVRGKVANREFHTGRPSTR